MCFTAPCKQDPLPQRLLKPNLLKLSFSVLIIRVISGMCGKQAAVCCTLLLPLARSNRVGGFYYKSFHVLCLFLAHCWITVMWWSHRLLSLHQLLLGLTHCGIVCKKPLVQCCLLWWERKTALNNFMNEWSNDIWSDAQDKRCLVCVSALLCPSYSHDW